MRTWLTVIEALGAAGWNVYMLSTIVVVIMRRSDPIFRTIRNELRPFSLVILAAMRVPQLMLDRAHWWTYLLIGVDLLAWWLYRKNDDDDRWKKRRQKLADKVAEIGGRLQVV